jgi:hypothetical protein
MIDNKNGSTSDSEVSYTPISTPSEMTDKEVATLKNNMIDEVMKRKDAEVNVGRYMNADTVKEICKDVARDLETAHKNNRGVIDGYLLGNIYAVAD